MSKPPNLFEKKHKWIVIAVKLINVLWQLYIYSFVIQSSIEFLIILLNLCNYKTVSFFTAKLIVFITCLSRLSEKLNPLLIHFWPRFSFYTLISNPLKTPENERLSGVFRGGGRGVKMRILVRNRSIMSLYKNFRSVVW